MTATCSQIDGDIPHAFRLAQDGKDLWFTKSAGLHQNLLDHKARENSTFEARYLPGGYQTTAPFLAVKSPSPLASPPSRFEREMAPETKKHSP